MMLIGIATWVVLSGPVALALGQLLRRRSAELEVAPGGGSTATAYELVG